MNLRLAQPSLLEVVDRLYADLAALQAVVDDALEGVRNVSKLSVTVRHAADLLDVSDDHIMRLVADGELRSFPSRGRVLIPVADIEGHMERALGGEPCRKGETQTGTEVSTKTRRLASGSARSRLRASVGK